MTTPDPNDLRDPRLDAAWRAASSEEPPAALDDAIRAAARREVRAAPKSPDAKKATVPSALRPESWWAPLAAAAAIGAIAIGILQVAGPDKATAPTGEKAVVSDMPESTAKEKVRAESASDAAPAPAAAESGARSRVAAPSPPPAQAPAAMEPPKALRKDAGLVAPAAAPVDEHAAMNAPVPAAEPFPADAVKREAKQAGVDALPPPASAPAESGAPGMAAGKFSSAPAPASQGASMRDAQSATAPVSQSFAPKPAAPARRLQESESARNAAGAGGATSAELDAAVDARAKTQAKLAVPDWIALIRKLRDEGKTDEAAKEITAFRAAHSDHERLLPPDLRDWRPVAK